MKLYKYKYFILLLLSFSLFSQKKSGKIKYEISSIDFELNEQKNKKLIGDMISTAQQQKFYLEFNSVRAKFYKIDIINNSSNDNTKESIMSKLASIRFTMDFNFYLSKDNDFSIYEKNDGTLIKNKIENYDWQISTESKKIGNYLCYKAICNKSYIRNGVSKTRPITAWFAPSLPYSYGPNEYYGLPGLILELQEKETIYLATNINFLENEIEIDLPKGKTIAEDQYNEKVMSR